MKSPQDLLNPIDKLDSIMESLTPTESEGLILLASCIIFFIIYMLISLINLLTL